MDNIKKYKWLYLWISAVALIVFSLLMIILKDFGQSVVAYVSAALLIILVIIRFIPLIKTIKNKWAICANAIEMFIDLVCGVLLIVFTVNTDDISLLNIPYAFILGGVIYLRGLCYIVETTFFETKAETLKFMLHIVLLSAGVVIMSRFESFSLESFRWIIGVAFGLSGIIATIDGYNNYNNYRKLYAPSTKKKEKAEVVDDKKLPYRDSIPNEIIEPKDERDQDIVC